MPSRKADLVRDSLEPLILVIRNQRVILDADLAGPYKGETQGFRSELDVVLGKKEQGNDDQDR